jgi:hypothetical protein
VVADHVEDSLGLGLDLLHHPDRAHRLRPAPGWRRSPRRRPRPCGPR